MIRESIEAAVKEALQSLQAGDVSFVVERPGDMAHGDYSTNAALAAAKSLKKNPREVAEQLSEILKTKFSKTKSAGLLVKLFGGSSLSSIEKIEVAGAGFINFFLSRDAITSEVEAATKEPWGKNSVYAGKKIMVEFTDPNPFKEFHIGHLMSNTIGESVARLLERGGAQVIRANYQGDVGQHVAKAIWGRMQKPELRWGEAYVYGNNEYEAHKEEIDAINKKVYDKSDATVSALYDQGRKESLEHFEELYKVLGTKFDHYFFESQTAPIALQLVNENKNVFEESEGAIVFHGEHTRVFITSQGLPTYEAKDLGLLQLKQETVSVDESITVTASEQKDYFKVVLAAAKQIPAIADIAAKTKHVTHGMMRFASGKMSSRKGNVITGESLIAELTEDAKEKMRDRNLPDADKIAEEVAVGGIKYEVLKQGSGKDIIFDPAKSLSLEGDSGPYIQYAHTRALSLMNAAKEAGIVGNTSDAPLTASVLEKTLLHFPDAVERAAKELEPHYVTTYITELAAAFNSWYANERVIGGSNPHYGVLLTEAVEQTLAKGLHVLGIPAPEKM